MTATSIGQDILAGVTVGLFPQYHGMGVITVSLVIKPSSTSSSPTPGLSLSETPRL